MGRKMTSDEFEYLHKYTYNKVLKIKRILYYFEHTNEIILPDGIGKEDLIKIIDESNIHEFKKIFFKRFKGLKDLSKTEMMILAKELNIVNYSRISKYELYLVLKHLYKGKGKKYAADYRKFLK